MRVACGVCGAWCVVRGAWCAGVWCVACLHVPHVYNYPPIVFLPATGAEAVLRCARDDPGSDPRSKIIELEQIELEALIERSANQRESGLSLW